MMNESDCVLSRRLRECVSGKRLPSGFSERLVRSVRRRRRTMRVFAVVSLIVVCMLGMGSIGYFTSADRDPTSEDSIVAAQGPLKSERVSGWMFIGFLRECFKRNKTNKRKEEE